MKKVIGFLFVFVSFVLSSTAQTTLTEGVGWNGAAPGVHEKFQLVRIGATYDYEVEKHVTKTLKQILDGADGNDNRYFWEVVKVTDGDESAFTYTGGTFTNLTKDNFVSEAKKYTNQYPHTFAGARKGEYYVIRVYGFANHESENVVATSLTADFKTKTIAEILIKIAGEIEVIIPDPIPGDPILADKNKDVFSCWEADKDFQAEFDDENGNYGKTKVFIGASLPAKGFHITLEVITYKKNTKSTQEMSYPIPSSELTYQADKGSYLYEFGWQDLLKNYAFTLDTNASVDDIYHVVSVKSVTHRDGNLILTEEQQKKASRTYGLYHPTKITKIQHNK